MLRITRNVICMTSIILISLSWCQAFAKAHRIETDILPFWSRTDIIPILNGYGVIYFYVEDPEIIPADFNLLTFFDIRALEHKFAVEVFEIFADTNDILPFKVHLIGKGSVPFWFITEEKLALAIADGILTMTELESLNPIKGFATHFAEDLHPVEMQELGIIGGHRYPRLTAEAKGELLEGGTFHFNLKDDLLKGDLRIWGKLILRDYNI